MCLIILLPLGVLLVVMQCNFLCVGAGRHGSRITEHGAHEHTAHRFTGGTRRARTVRTPDTGTLAQRTAIFKFSFTVCGTSTG
jgi:hypothetical protein